MLLLNLIPFSASITGGAGVGGATRGFSLLLAVMMAGPLSVLAIASAGAPREWLWTSSVPRM